MLALARWSQTQVGARLSGQEMLAVAAERARALDKQESTYAKGKPR
jgi:hypothetical protein